MPSADVLIIGSGVEDFVLQKRFVTKECDYYHKGDET